MRYISKLIWIPLLTTLLLSSCEEVIEVDLNDAATQYVIEGIVTDEPAPYQVRISQTVPFDELNDFPAVSDALVVITDDAGNTDTLVEKLPGLYESTGAVGGKSGRTYSLRVVIGEEVFSASSTMPAVVPFADLKIDDIQFGGANGLAVTPVFTDPIGLGNNYQFIEIINGRRLPNIFVLDDRNSDGANLSRPLIGVDKGIRSGDTVTVEMRSIDRATYKYFVALDASTGNGPNASVPANPDNNFKGACLGYFSAHTVQRKTLLVP